MGAQRVLTGHPERSEHAETAGDIDSSGNRNGMRREESASHPRARAEISIMRRLSGSVKRAGSDYSMSLGWLSW